MNIGGAPDRWPGQHANADDWNGAKQVELDQPLRFLVHCVFKQTDPCQPLAAWGTPPSAFALSLLVIAAGGWLLKVTAASARF